MPKAKTKLIDKAKALGVGKRTLQSWAELGCPTDGTPDEIARWRASTRELEPPIRGRRKFIERLTMEDSFQELCVSIEQRKDAIAYSDNGAANSAEIEAAYDELDESLKSYIRELWLALSNNHYGHGNKERLFKKWFALALDGCN